MQARNLIVLALSGVVGCSSATVDKHPPPPVPEAAEHAPPETRAPVPVERQAPPPEPAGIDTRAELTPGTPPPSDPPTWWKHTDLDHPQVEHWKKTFQTRYEKSLQNWIEDASPYAPHVRTILREEGLPPELWVLTLLESGLQPQAQSSSAAVGPWQFLAPTARHAGLLLSADRDQRRDWEDATRAACRYLNELRDEFGNGLLALAAFNCGPGRVHRAMADAQNANFWALDLPEETERYVPRALALAALIGTGNRDPFRMDPDAALTYETVTLPHPVGVDALARVCETTPAELRRLNPSWLRGVSPEDGHPVRARVPAGKRKAVRAALADGALAQAPELASTRVHHVVAGETLWGIAHRYGTELSELMRANHLPSGAVIRPGQLLRIPG